MQIGYVQMIDDLFGELSDEYSKSNIHVEQYMDWARSYFEDEFENNKITD